MCFYFYFDSSSLPFAIYIANFEYIDMFWYRFRLVAGAAAARSEEEKLPL